MPAAWFRGLEISASGLTAERLRMDVIANNIANAGTTRTPGGGAYRRQVVLLEAREPRADFGAWLAGYLGGAPALPWGPQPAAVGDGVRVVRVAADPSPLRRRYEPAHPDADPATGFVELPNVEPITEMVDLIGATRAYEANVTALNASKAMAVRALEIGR